MERRRREERSLPSHPDDLDPLFIIGEPGVDRLQPVRIFQGGDHVHEIYAMLTGTGTGGKRHGPVELCSREAFGLSSFRHGLG